MGFYYRRSKVDAISTAYCGDLVFGCFPKLTQQEKNLITRPPFIGSFQSGDFDFSVLVGHSRFRKHKDERKYQQIRDEILVDDFSEPIDFSIRETDEVIMGIYADAYHFGKIAQDVKNANPDEQDVIVAGDFNFPGTFEGQLNDWKTILDISYPGAEVVNNFETTVSQKEGVTPWEERHENRSDYASYDHFILDSMNSAECDVESNEALNFIPMIDEKFSLNGPWEERLQKLTAYREKLLAELVIEPGDDAEEERLDFTEDFNRRVLDPENLHDTWTLTEKELKRIADGKKIRTMGPFRSHLELISDHLPIAITCNTSFGDDD